MTAPVSLIISAFAPVDDVRRTLTPQLRIDAGPTRLLLVDLGNGRNRLGGSALAQVHGVMGHEVPDLDDPNQLRALFDLVQTLVREGRVLAYHDRSDGGLLATLAEMSFAARVGLRDRHSIALAKTRSRPCSTRSSVPCCRSARRIWTRCLSWPRRSVSATRCMIWAASPRTSESASIMRVKACSTSRRIDLHRAWSETTFRMQSLRDHPDCAREEYDRLLDDGDPGLWAPSQLRYR